MGLTVSVDLNYRAKLWKYGVPAPDVMREIFKFADVGIANEEECQKSLGIGVRLRRRTGLDRKSRPTSALALRGHEPNFRDLKRSRSP